MTRSAYRPLSLPAPYRFCQFTVAFRLAVRNLAHFFPYFPLKSRPLRIKRQIKGRALPLQILLQLLFRLP